MLIRGLGEMSDVFMTIEFIWWQRAIRVEVSQNGTFLKSNIFLEE